MIAPFAEAIRATIQPCSLLLVVPPLAAVLVTRARWASLVAVMVGAVVGGWLFAADAVSLDGWALQVSGLLVGATLLAVVLAPKVPRLRWARDDRVQATAAGSIALIATMWWRPCVGTELGKILTGSRNGVIGQLAPMAGYMLGAIVPVALAVFVLEAVRPNDQAPRWAAAAGLAVGGLTALALTVGRHDQLVSTLTAWSTA